VVTSLLGKGIKMYKEQEYGKKIACQGKTRICSQEEFGERFVGDFQKCVEDGCISSEDLKDDIYESTNQSSSDEDEFVVNGNQYLERSTVDNLVKSGVINSRPR